MNVTVIAPEILFKVVSQKNSIGEKLRKSNPDSEDNHLRQLCGVS